MQNAEPGWMAGEIRGHTGWFPESYVEPVDTGTTDLDNERTFIQQDSVEKRTLELVIFIYVGDTPIMCRFMYHQVMAFLF